GETKVLTYNEHTDYKSTSEQKETPLVPLTEIVAG
ncbi:MAG: hypothetical protein Harvfovirus71_1, partial [Harvfovirus sp.]